MSILDILRCEYPIMQAGMADISRSQLASAVSLAGGIGTIGFYLMLLTSVSFYWRKTIGQKNWRRLHYLTFGVYIMGTLHGWMAGTDSATLGPLYLISGLVVIFLTAYRIVDASTK